MLIAALWHDARLLGSHKRNKKPGLSPGPADRPF
jgi:hypothetical protein